MAQPDVKETLKRIQQRWRDDILHLERLLHGQETTEKENREALEALRRASPLELPAEVFTQYELLNTGLHEQTESTRRLLESAKSQLQEVAALLANLE